MNNLIKLNEDKVVRGGVEVYFKNFAIGSYNGDTMSMVYIWDKYVMTLPDAFYIARGAEEMAEQFDFIDSIIADEIDNNSSEVMTGDKIEIFFPFVTATIDKSADEGFPYVVYAENTKSGVAFHESSHCVDLAVAKSTAIKDCYRLSKDAQTEAATEIWQKE